MREQWGRWRVTARGGWMTRGIHFCVGSLSTLPPVHSAHCGHRTDPQTYVAVARTEPAEQSIDCKELRNWWRCIKVTKECCWLCAARWHATGSMSREWMHWHCMTLCVSLSEHTDTVWHCVSLSERTDTVWHSVCHRLCETCAALTLQCMAVHR